jgi:hypothetical protein
MQPTQYPAQPGKQPIALSTLLGMPLHPPAPAQAKLSVEIVRHSVQRPAMIAASTNPIEELAHLWLDPVKGREGSHAIDKAFLTAGNEPSTAVKRS